MAKQRIRGKKGANPEDARQTKKFFTITAVVVLALLVIIYLVGR